MYETVLTLLVEATDRIAAERMIRDGYWLLPTSAAYEKIVPIRPSVVVPTGDIVDFSLLGVIPFVSDDASPWGGATVPFVAAVRALVAAPSLEAATNFLSSRLWLCDDHRIECLGFTRPLAQGDLAAYLV